MKRNFTILFGIGMLFSVVSFSQKAPAARPKPKCSTMEYMRRAIANNPGLVNQWRLEGERQYSEYLAKVANGTAEKIPAAGEIIIPIVFHIVDTAGAQAATSDRDIIDQVEILNQDYSGSKAIRYKDVIPAAAYSRVGNIPVKFVLARRTPAGAATNGIERRTAASQDHISIKANATGGLDAWDVTKYMNVWVGTFSGADDGLLGIATFPFTTDEGAQGVVIGTNTLPIAANIGKGYIPNYSEGATLSHEIGHYFYLFHTFGDDASCNNFDFDLEPGWPLPNGGAAADDTPNETGADAYIFGNPSRDYSPGTCPSPAFGIIYGSYMNYFDDRALFMFTNGQKARVTDCINLYRSGLISSNGATPPAAVTDAFLVNTSISGSLERAAFVTNGTPLSVKVRNAGTTTLTSIRVSVSIDGGAPTTTTFPVSIAAGNETSLSLAPVTGASTAAHVYKIYTSAPNGGTDNYLYNDTVYRYIVTNQNLATAPLTENFTSTTFPPANWYIWNPNGTATSAWTRSTNSGFGAVGSAIFANYDIDEAGTLDDLVSPAIDFGTKDSSILTFRVAHADYNINDLSSWDGLEVLVSGDGGATFQLAYKKTGDKLRTIATSQSGTFSATPAQTGRWRSDSVNLTTYIQPGKRLFVVFRNVNAFGNNTIIDDISITAAQKVVVPLRLISFTGSKQNGFNQLNWKTANEVNTKEFSLEYSTDATNFSALATINSDRSSLEANYHYNHLNPAKQNFYRLKMIDIDGRFTYSNTVKLSGEGNLLVYPTPAKELISVSGLDKKGDIRLLSADGKLVLTQTVTSNVQTINIGQLAKGVYVLQYINGNSFQTQKIIKE